MTASALERGAPARATTTPADSAARDRVQAVLAGATGIAALVFGAIHTPKILSQWDDVQGWYAVLAVIAGVLLPGSLAVLGRVLKPRVLTWALGTTVVVFAIAHAMWPFAMVSPALENVPWMQGVNAIPAFLAAVAWQRWQVWVYAVSQWPIVAATQWATTSSDLKTSALSGTVSLLFSTILVGIGVAIMRAAERQDGAAEGARREAALAAAARTVAREEARINGIVHDRVLAALVIAAREDHSADVLIQAKAALDSLDRLGLDRDDDHPYTPEETIDAVRAAVASAGGDGEFWTSMDGNMEIPADVARALSEATAEAVKNSRLHADRPGIGTQRVVRVSIADGGAQVIVQDDGVGFNSRSVPERRLGVRVSILDRMRMLEGGEARIDSRRGQGTTVTLTWWRNPR